MPYLMAVPAAMLCLLTGPVATRGRQQHVVVLHLDGALVRGLSCTTVRVQEQPAGA